MSKSLKEPPGRRHTETAQNAVAEDGAQDSASDAQSDAEGTRILLIVVAMVLLMFVIAVVGLLFVARPNGIMR